MLLCCHTSPPVDCMIVTAPWCVVISCRHHVPALDDAPQKEEPHRTRALPPRQNKIGCQFRWLEIWIADNPCQAMAMQERPIYERPKEWELIPESRLNMCESVSVSIHMQITLGVLCITLPVRQILTNCSKYGYFLKPHESSYALCAHNLIRKTVGSFLLNRFWECQLSIVHFHRHQCICEWCLNLVRNMH